MNHAHPRRIDWWRVFALVAIVASGIVAAVVLYGVLVLALAVL